MGVLVFLYDGPQFVIAVPSRGELYVLIVVGVMMSMLNPIRRLQSFTIGVGVLIAVTSGLIAWDNALDMFAFFAGVGGVLIAASVGVRPGLPRSVVLVTGSVLFIWLSFLNGDFSAWLVSLPTFLLFTTLSGKATQALL